VKGQDLCKKLVSWDGRMGLDAPRCIWHFHMMHNYQLAFEANHDFDI